MGLGWLVVHGSAVPWAALPLFVLAGVALPWAVAFVRAWWTARAVRRGSPGGSDRWEEGAPIALAGRLELQGRACERFEDGAAVAVATVRSRHSAASGSARGERLLLHAGQEMELVGPVEIRVGSREDAGGASLNELGSAVAQRVVGALEGVGLDEPLEFSSLASGDRVRVEGRLERRQFEALDGHGYRQDARGWKLVPLDAGAALPLSFGELPRPRRPRGRGALMGALAGAALYVAAFWGGGTLALDTGALEAAAATPRRSAALARLQNRYEVTSRDDPAEFERLVALGGLRGDACGLTRRLREGGQLERARRTASECSDAREAELLSLCFLRSGRFSEASAVLDAVPASGTRRVRADLHVNVHLLAGEPRRALRRLEHLTERSFPDGVPAEAVAMEHESRARERCLRAALAVRLRGDESALERLRDQAASGPARLACTLLYADLMQGEERVRALDACDKCRLQESAKAVRWLLGVTAACPRHQERSPVCQAWLADARRSMEHEHWAYGKLEEWLLHADPALENEAGAYLVQLDRRVDRVMDAYTWTRDASGNFRLLTAPSAGNAAELLEELRRARAAGRTLAPERLKELALALEGVSNERALSSAAALTPASLEPVTCFAPRTWFDGELEPRRTLARLMWTTRAPGASDSAQRVELWLSIAAFRDALLRRDTAVLLSVLHL